MWVFIHLVKFGYQVATFMKIAAYLACNMFSLCVYQYQTVDLLVILTSVFWGWNFGFDCTSSRSLLTFEPFHGKTINVVSEQVQHKSGCTVTEAG